MTVQGFIQQSFNHVQRFGVYFGNKCINFSLFADFHYVIEDVSLGFEICLICWSGAGFKFPQTYGCCCCVDLLAFLNRMLLLYYSAWLNWDDNRVLLKILSTIILGLFWAVFISLFVNSHDWNETVIPDTDFPARGLVMDIVRGHWLSLL